MTTVERLYEQALQLAPDEFRELLESLLATLDAGQEVVTPLSQEWTTESVRRLADLESGRVEGISWDTLKRQLDESIHAKPGD